MQILLPGGKTSPDMPLRLIYIQNLPGLPRQTGIDLFQAFCDVCWCLIRNKNFRGIFLFISRFSKKP